MVSGTKTGDSMQFFASSSFNEISRARAMASRSSSSFKRMVSQPGGKGHTGVGTIVAVFSVIGVRVKVGSPG